MNLFSDLRLIMLPKEKINQVLPIQGLIYEVGCGKGMLGAYIAKTSTQRQIIGIDMDTQKINFAKQNYSNSQINFTEADAVTYNYKQCIGVLFSDFLHHLSYFKQEEILKRISGKLVHKGTLVIKEIDKDDGILMLFSRIWDFIFYPKDKIYYRTRKQWKKIIEDLGFTVRVTREVLWFPGSTHLFVCQKK